MEEGDSKLPPKRLRENYSRYVELIYTTNAIESFNSVIRKAMRRHKIFPYDETALKVVYLTITEASKKWSMPSMPIRNWRLALNRLV
ncbi:hypothetical protein AAEX37_00172 [Oligella sp. MSHR50489EDL]